MQSFHLQLLGHHKEGLDIFLCNRCLASVGKVQDRLHKAELDAAEEDEWVRVVILLQDLAEEWRAGRQDHLGKILTDWCQMPQFSNADLSEQIQII